MGHDLDSTTSISPALAGRVSAKQAPAVDALYTQVAVSFLSIDNQDPVASLIAPVQMLRDATAVDAAFVALLGDDTTIESVVASLGG